MSGVLAFQLQTWNFFFHELVSGLAVGSLYALIALGYTMVYGVLKLLNFAHGDVYMVGAYIGFFVLNALGSPLTPIMPIVPLILLAFAASMVGCGVLGVVIERFAYRPLRKAPRIAPLISAIGVSFFLQQTAVLLWSPNPRSYDTFSLRPGSSGIGELFRTAFTIGNFSIQYVQLVVILSTIALMIGLSLFVWRTRTGKAMRAVSYDAEASSMMGIDVDRVITVTFLIGSALAGAAGRDDRVDLPAAQPVHGLRRRAEGVHGRGRGRDREHRRRRPRRPPHRPHRDVHGRLPLVPVLGPHPLLDPGRLPALPVDRDPRRAGAAEGLT